MKRRFHAAMQRRRVFLISFCSIFIAAFMLTGCNRGNENQGAAQDNTPVFAVNTTLAVQGQIQDHVNFSGDIFAGSTVDVFSDAAGRVAQIHTAVGRRVNRGDPVVSVDPSRPGMTFRHSIATAPISGTVIAIPAQVGQTISQAVPLARITGGSALEVRLNISERFISRMAMNLPCEITLDAWPGETFRGSISEISPTVDPISRTMEVRVNVLDTDSKLKPGMFAKVRIITEVKDNIVKIPSGAIVNRFGEQFVFVIEHERGNDDTMRTVARKRIVQPGIIIDGVAEILSGLSPNEELILRGQTLLDDGSRVNIIEQVSPLSSAISGSANTGA